ncbi:MAG: hypothetical protein D6773_18040, partial [Alphaproteobacteria bacterium]
MPENLPLVEVKPARMPMSLAEEWALLFKQRWCSFRHAWADDVYWDRLGNETVFEHIAYVSGRRADLVIGHEFFSAPLAARLAQHWGARFTIDCHELAAEQYLHDPSWVRHWQAYVMAIEARYLPRADLVTTICGSIADELQARYGLDCRPMVVRSTPVYEQHEFRPLGERITVYYHGHI